MFAPAGRVVVQARKTAGRGRPAGNLVESGLRGQTERRAFLPPKGLPGLAAAGAGAAGAGWGVGAGEEVAATGAGAAGAATGLGVGTAAVAAAEESEEVFMLVMSAPGSGDGAPRTRGDRTRRASRRAARANRGPGGGFALLGPARMGSRWRGRGGCAQELHRRVRRACNPPAGARRRRRAVRLTARAGRIASTYTGAFAGSRRGRGRPPRGWR